MVKQISSLFKNTISFEKNETVRENTNDFFISSFPFSMLNTHMQIIRAVPSVVP